MIFSNDIPERASSSRVKIGEIMNKAAGRIEKFFGCGAVPEMKLVAQEVM
jgi:hypothetical protein